MKAIFALVALLVGLIAPAAAYAIDAKTLDMGKNVQVWYVEDHTLPMIAMTASLPAGSAYDPKDKAGLAAFTADLLNEGAGNLNSQAYQSALSNKAIRLNVSTARDYMIISLVTLSENAKDAFRLLGLALSRPRFEASAIFRVRTQILSAIREEEEDPDSVAAKGFFADYFHGHPYAHPRIGTLASVPRIGHGDIKSFAKSHWVRNGLRISISGDTDPAGLRALIASAFGKLPGKWPPPLPPAEHPGAPGVHVIPMPVPQPVAIFGSPGLLRSDKDFIPAYVANYILGGGGFSSRLMQQVREKRGLTYGIGTTLDTFRKAGIFVGQVATRARAMRQTVGVVKATIQNFAENGATGKELTDAKTYLTGSFSLAFASNVGIASQLNTFQRLGLPIDYMKKRNALINAVTLDDVNRAAKRLFRSTKLTFVIGGTPKGPPVTTKPVPGAGKPTHPAKRPPKPLPPKTHVAGHNPPFASSTAAKPKQRKTPAANAPPPAPHP